MSKEYFKKDEMVLEEPTKEAKRRKESVPAWVKEAGDINEAISVLISNHREVDRKIKDPSLVKQYKAIQRTYQKEEEALEKKRQLLNFLEEVVLVDQERYGEELVESTVGSKQKIYLSETIYRSYMDVMKTALSLWELKLGNRDKNFRIIRESLMDKTNKVVKEIFDQFQKVHLVRPCRCDGKKNCNICRGIGFVDNGDYSNICTEK